MKFVDEYRDAKIADQYVKAIAQITTRPWQIMEICGGQTHSIVKYGIDELLPQSITLIHGPGCPVCVTPVDLIDKAIALASRREVIFCSFGDMLRVPGSQSQDLRSVKAMGGDIRIVYSPLDAVKIAGKNPDRQIIFFAVGFETTVPTTAMAVYQAEKLGIKNFFLLVAHVLVSPGMELILSSPDNCVQGFLAAGHVCTITGYREYNEIAQKYQIPIVVTGFEPLDILQGIYMCVKQLEADTTEVENQYSRSVSFEGNKTAQKLVAEVFATAHRQWRGIGLIPHSGLRLQESYSQFDALNKFKLEKGTTSESLDCISGLILQGIKKPHQCSAFGKHCTPEKPLGAPMVSSEGACAAYYRYRQLAKD
ncbi:hydrogenase expression/formation protein HypD [Xenococcus sp. PCC 7305]|uniref:hydrogenase formation protein HypD n=1 Tax=Xenococcus sp. PCC 7305 TaxID=102125 RepID=UPI0002AC1B1C|nr:hydrogenase formation protein HypD [Xenococcus sp. PCC 7305]ELS00764.1 hydrogenase expression/formation protein HypD [Xenococcus sp. PCC 7305]